MAGLLSFQQATTVRFRHALPASHRVAALSNRAGEREVAAPPDLVRRALLAGQHALGLVEKAEKCEYEQ